MNYLTEDVLALVEEAVGELGTVAAEGPDGVRIEMRGGSSLSFRMKMREETREPLDQHAPMLWILKRPKKRELEALRADGGSFVALPRTVRIQGPGILIDRTDLQGPKRAVRTGQRSAFSDRASLLPRWLFSQATHTRWSLTSLATAAGVSLSVASYAVRDLAERGLADVEKRGRERWIGLSGHRSLIEAWAREYEWRDNESLTVQAPIGSEKRFMARLPSLPLPRYALTLQGGAGFRFPHAPVEQVVLYVEVGDADGLTKLARRMNWPPDPQGRLRFLRPHHKTSAWTGVELHDGVPVVSDLQLILDLWHHPIRGREQAELILEKHLHALGDA